jgi:RsiW-degrading membrane proteinase PrsW (M82 family)
MNQTASAPSKFWAVASVIVGGLLLLSGVVSALGYLGLPLLTSGGDFLGPQLGVVAGMFLGLVCGSLAVIHGSGTLLGRPSRPMRLPPVWFFWIAFAVVLGLGNLMLNFHFAEAYLFPLLFVLGAALPTLGVLAWITRRLGWPISTRQGALALVAGSTLSILVAIVAESILPYLAYVFIGPLQFLAASFGDLLSGGGTGFIERLFYSPLAIVILITTAVAAPIPEEIAKSLPLLIFGRRRIQSERQAFAIGVASGAGFAILENMLYQGLYAQANGWTWGGITLLRGIGAVMHPLCSGLVALGWYRMRERGVGAWVKALGLAIGIHTLWNGGFDVFVFFSGLSYYNAGTVSLYGLATEVLLVAFLAALALGLWWLLRRQAANLAQDVTADLAPEIVSTRALAGWAFACALVVVPIGAALGGAWPQIAAVVAGGR